MIGLTYEQIIEKIQIEKGLSGSEIELRVKKKLHDLADLISKEGAAYIVANELNVKIFEDFGKKTLKINQLMPGMAALNILGKVIEIYSVHEFSNEARKGKVASLLMGDETGAIRTVFWDTNHIKEIESGNLAQDQTIKIKNAYVRENNGFRELHVGNRSSIDLNPEEKILQVNLNYQRNLIKKSIKDLKENEFAAITGTIVQVFEPRFYDACSECGKKVINENGRQACSMHPNSVITQLPVFNFYLDDGTDNIRLVAFRDHVSKLITNINEIKNNIALFDNVRNELLGNQYKFSGKVTKNEMFDRKEFVVNNIEELNVNEVTEELVKEIDV
ncbi:MAG: hypothetical protein AABX55_02350 [Nanoarchaeota archaeon]